MGRDAGGRARSSAAKADKAVGKSLEAVRRNSERHHPTRSAVVRTPSARDPFAWWTMAVAAVVLVFAVGAYAAWFTELSDKPRDWDAFGSYLAGVSALVVGFGTILLLLRNVDLLRRQVDVATKHLGVQEVLIADQREALRRQERKELSAEIERSLDRILDRIQAKADVSAKAWHDLRSDTARAARGGRDHGEATPESVNTEFLKRWRQLALYPELMKLRDLLRELHERYTAAERDGLADGYWAAWIARSLPETALQVLYYEAREAPREAVASWVRNHGLMRYAGVSMLVQEQHEMPDLPLR
jgi:hypothetical protein